MEEKRSGISVGISDNIVISIFCYRRRVFLRKKGTVGGIGTHPLLENFVLSYATR